MMDDIRVERARARQAADDALSQEGVLHAILAEQRQHGRHLRTVAGILTFWLVVGIVAALAWLVLVALR